MNHVGLMWVFQFALSFLFFSFLLGLVAYDSALFL